MFTLILLLLLIPIATAVAGVMLIKGKINFNQVSSDVNINGRGRVITKENISYVANGVAKFSKGTFDLAKNAYKWINSTDVDKPTQPPKEAEQTTSKINPVIDAEEIDAMFSEESIENLPDELKETVEPTEAPIEEPIEAPIEEPVELVEKPKLARITVMEEYNKKNNNKVNDKEPAE